VTGLAAAFLLRVPLGPDAVIRGLGGLGIALAVGILLYALRAIGGGDVKLLAGVGAFLGSTQVVGALAFMAVLGMAYALVSVIRKGVLPLLLINTLDLVRSLTTLGRSGQSRKLESPAVLTIPYGIPIAVGTLVWWFGNGVRL
jgi:prepilin peptidase CpaA